MHTQALLPPPPPFIVIPYTVYEVENKPKAATNIACFGEVPPWHSASGASFMQANRQERAF